MIKCRYVALVEVDYAIDEKQCKNVYPMSEIKKHLEGFTPELKKMIENEWGREATVNVTQQYADVYQVGEQHES